MKTEMGNKPSSTNTGTIINKPPWPSLGSPKRLKLCSKKNTRVNSPLVALCTSAYQGSATSTITAKYRIIFHENNSSYFFCDKAHHTNTAPGKASATGPLASVARAAATAEQMS